MAFKKFVRKAYRKGKKAYKFYKKNQSKADAALALAKKVARQVNTEVKYRLNSIASPIDDNGTVFRLCTVPVGDQETERIGDSIKTMRVSGRLFITQNESAQKTALRCILFRGKQERGEDYAVSGGDNYILSTTATQTYLAPKSENKKYASKILYDKLYHMSNNGNSSLILNWNFKLFGHVQYTSSDDTGETIEDGGLYLLVISNETTNTPSFNAELRFTYTDN